MTNLKKQIFYMCSFSLLLVACSGDNDDLLLYMAQVKKRVSREIGTVPVFSPLPGFKFPNEGDRRSPFKPINQKKQMDQLAPDQLRPRQPLEAFLLDSLSFVGILKQEQEVWALIKQPDGKITPVQEGDYMGQNYGSIVAISDDTIQLEEITKNSGKWEHHRTTLNLLTRK